MYPDNNIWVRNGRKFQTYRGAGSARSPTAFSPMGYVFEHLIGTLSQPKHFSMSWRDSFASLGGIGAFSREKEDDGFVFEQVLLWSSNPVNVFLPKESMFVKHVVLVVLSVRGQFEYSHQNRCNSRLCCNVFILRMSLDSFSGLC